MFDHPERRNAISVEMWEQVPVALQEISEDETIRVAVLRGEGDVAFVAGADISEFGEQRSGRGDAPRTTSAAAGLSPP